VRLSGLIRAPLARKPVLLVNTFNCGPFMTRQPPWRKYRLTEVGPFAIHIAGRAFPEDRSQILPPLPISPIFLVELDTYRRRYKSSAAGAIHNIVGIESSKEP
jgi:hypothetical protein